MTDNVVLQLMGKIWTENMIMSLNRLLIEHVQQICFKPLINICSNSVPSLARLYYGATDLYLTSPDVT